MGAVLFAIVMLVVVFFLIDIITPSPSDNRKVEPRHPKIDENIPRCPTCQSTDIEKISGTKRFASTTMWGLSSSDIGKTMECKHCGYKW